MSILVWIESDLGFETPERTESTKVLSFDELFSK